MVTYWADRLNKEHLTARQIFGRRGVIGCELSKDKNKVVLTGKALTYLAGEITL